MENLGEIVRGALKQAVNQAFANPSLLPNRLEINLRCGKDEEVAAFVESLQRNEFPYLHTLELGFVGNVKAVGYEPLAAAMEEGNLPELHHLHLWQNQLEKVSLDPIARVLASGTLYKLQTIVLRLNFLSEQDVATLATALQSGHVSNLRRLTLGTFSTNVKLRIHDMTSVYISASPKLFLGIYEKTESDARKVSSFGKTAAETLCTALQSGKLPHLQKLDILGINEDGIIAMTEVLKLGRFVSFFLTLHIWVESNLEGGRVLKRTLQMPGLEFVKELQIDGLYRSPYQDVAGAFNSRYLYDLLFLQLADASSFDHGLDLFTALSSSGSLPALRYFRQSIPSPMTDINARALVEAYRQNRSFVAEWLTGRNWPSSRMRQSAERFRKNNLKLVESLRVLKHESDVNANHAKVFLCGHPNVGKTTLRESLCRRKFDSLVRMGRKARHTDRTRGIELSHIVEENLHLSLWDLAGQAEYHLLHSAFLPDLAFADGQATIFVIVCSANYTGEQDVALAEQELLYWMKFISSSSIKGITRYVFVALNSFDGVQQAHDGGHWSRTLADCQTKFADFLKIHPEPFVLNAQRRKHVADIKNKLVETAQFLLRGKKVKKICAEIQTRISEWLKANQDYPILDWKRFSSTIGAGLVSEEVLVAATTYLHEVGHLIYFREGALREGGLNDKSLVIVDPEWFCMSIVGNLLLPERLLTASEFSLRRKVRADGFLSMMDFQLHFPEQLKDASRVQPIFAMFMRLGLAYKISDTQIFVPALIEKDEVPHYWNRCTYGQWVMGFSLVLADTERTLLPIVVLRKTQILLAQDPDIGRRSDSQYACGKNMVTFTIQGMGVLVQYISDPGNVKQERVDILVRPLVDRQNPSSASACREKQVNLAQLILDMVVEVSVGCCPGVELSKRVMRPWSTKEGNWLPAGARNVQTEVEEVKNWLTNHGTRRCTSWEVDGELVPEVALLSEADLQDLSRSTEEKCTLIEKLLEEFDLRETPPLVEKEPDEILVTDASRVPSMEMIIRRVVQSENRRLEEYLGKRFDEVMQGINAVRNDLDAALDKRSELIDKIQRFTVLERERSVPRFVYLASCDESRNGPSRWMRLREAIHLSRRSRIRFLCERHHDHHSLHEVDGQEGLELTQLKDWVRKLAPVLEWSLKVAFVAAKIAATVILPGLGLLVPDLIGQDATQNTSELGKATAELVSYFSSAIDGKSIPSETSSGIHVGVQSSIPRGDQALRGEGRAALKDLLGEMSHSDRLRKLRLRPVVITNNDGSPSDLVWICDNCFHHYGRKAREL